MKNSDVGVWAAAGTIGCGVIAALFAISFSIYTAIIYYGWNLVVSDLTGWQELTLLQSFLAALLLSVVRGVLTRKG